MTRKKLYFKPFPDGMHPRTKVLFVITKSNFGGAQRYVFDIATGLPRETYEVMVAAGRGPSGVIGRLGQRLGALGIPLTEIRHLARDMHLLSDIRAFFDLVGLMRTEQPDVVHLNSSKAAGIGALAARLAGVRRIVFTIHGLPADENRPYYQRLLIAFSTWITLMLAHRVITISTDAFARIRRLPFAATKTVCIFNGIEPVQTLSRTAAREALRALDANIPDGFLIGSIGELHRNKRYDRALAVIAHTDLHFVVIGDGEERAALTSHAAKLGITDRVHFLGALPDAAQYLSAFDVFLLTSEKEGLPYVLLEAGSAHVPIVASDLPGIRDIVQPDITGLLATREPEFAVALTRVRDTATAKSLTTEMANRISTSFSFSRMLSETIRCYE